MIPYQYIKSFLVSFSKPDTVWIITMCLSRYLSMDIWAISSLLFHKWLSTPEQRCPCESIGNYQEDTVRSKSTATFVNLITANFPWLRWYNLHIIQWQCMRPFPLTPLVQYMIKLLEFYTSDSKP